MTKKCMTRQKKMQLSILVWLLAKITSWCLLHDWHMASPYFPFLLSFAMLYGRQGNPPIPFSCAALWHLGRVLVGAGRTGIARIKFYYVKNIDSILIYGSIFRIFPPLPWTPMQQPSRTCLETQLCRKNSGMQDCRPNEGTEKALVDLSFDNIFWTLLTHLLLLSL